MLQYHASAGWFVGHSTCLPDGPSGCDVSRLRFDSSGLLVVPPTGIADGPAWRHLSDLRAGALQTLVATVIPNQFELDDAAPTRGAASACGRESNWWPDDSDDHHDDAHAAPLAVPFPMVRRSDGIAAAPQSTRSGSNHARRRAGAPAVTARSETVASAGRRAGGRQPARRPESPAVQCAGMQWQSPFIMRSV